MTIIKNYSFHNYNTNNNIDVKIGDAVKITLNSLISFKETFWVEIIQILNNGELLCTVQNKLMNIQPVNYLDEIIINKSNIKEHTEKNKRFDITPETKNRYKTWLRSFIIINGRMPTQDEFMAIYNIQIREFNL